MNPAPPVTRTRVPRNASSPAEEFVASFKGSIRLDWACRQPSKSMEQLVGGCGELELAGGTGQISLG